MLTNLAHVQVEHDPAAAERAARRSIAILETTHGPEHPHIRTPLFTLGRVLARRGRFDEAIEALERSVELRGHADADVEHRATAALELAKVLWESDRDRPRALALARRARAELSAGGNPQLLADLDAWIAERS
jgi:tetratricopeptide (TPR) repeat protein